MNFLERLELQAEWAPISLSYYSIAEFVHSLHQAILSSDILIGRWPPKTQLQSVIIYRNTYLA